jgi:GNAT superfamily N-acetyltransferase
MTWTLEALTPDRWKDFEALFASANGVCGGCWCMFWRLEKGESYDALKGEPARQRMKRLVQSGAALGVLAYEGEEPVGWLSYGPRRDYPKLDRAPSLAVEDADRVWSLPCFFVKRGHRGKGVARALLDRALESLQARGVEIAEAYPVRAGPGLKASPAFAYTGVVSLFEKAGFSVAQARPQGKQRVRKRLGPARSTKPRAKGR